MMRQWMKKVFLGATGGFVLLFLLTAQGLAQNLQNGVFYGEQGYIEPAAIEAKADVQDTVGVKRIPTGRYAGGVVLSFFVGFGLGSFLENDRLGLIVFATLDSVFLVTGASLLGASASNGSSGLYAGGVTMMVFYGLFRLAEFVYNVSYPFVTVRTSKAASNYRWSRERFVFSKTPLPFATSKGGGLGYVHQF